MECEKETSRARSSRKGFRKQQLSAAATMTSSWLRWMCLKQITIREYYNQGYSYRKIGELLGRSASTICREVKLQLNRCRESRCSPGSKNAAETGAFFKLYIG
ncbi:MAG: helix-turn-helix domain-containing protein [Clostridia bacterium]|nr:helix-turn-helix domain-containing protein [Clostridia bacterium]